MSQGPNRFTAQALDLQPYDPADPTNLMCELERRAAHDFHIRRLRRAEKRKDSDTSAILIGNMVAIAALLIANHQGEVNDEGLERLHAILDFAWVQALGIRDSSAGATTGPATRQ